MIHRAATIELVCPDLPTTVRLLRLQGHEALNEFFDFELEFLRPDAEVDLDACVRPSSRSALVFKLNEEVVRVVHGTLAELGTRIAQPESRDDAPLRTLVGRFVPRVWGSTLHYRTEVHRGTPEEIVSSVLGRCGLEKGVDYEFRLSESYPSREFVLQYHESDYDFLRRQCEHWGVGWSFEHGTRDRLIFSDHNGALLDVAF